MISLANLAYARPAIAAFAAMGVLWGTFAAVLLGLEGNRPETVDPDYVDKRAAEIGRIAGARDVDRRGDEEHDPPAAAAEGEQPREKQARLRDESRDEAERIWRRRIRPRCRGV